MAPGLTSATVPFGAVRALWAHLEARGVPTVAAHTHGHHHPHLSCAVLPEWELEPVRAALASSPDGGSFPVTVQGTTVCPRGRAALAVAVPVEIMGRQQAVTECLRTTGAQLHRYYLPGAWTKSMARLPGAARGHRITT